MDSEIDWSALSQFKTLTRDNLVLCLSSVEDMRLARDKGFPFYYGFPVLTAERAKALVDFGVSYLVVDGPLFFQMDWLATLNIPVRITPNIAYSDGIPRENGVCGTWVRPEDLNKFYQKYNIVVEFAMCENNRDREKAYFRIYSQEKSWDSYLDFLIFNLDVPAVGRMINQESMKNRLNCGQKCCSGGRCRTCYHQMTYANKDIWVNYFEAFPDLKPALRANITEMKDDDD